MNTRNYSVVLIALVFCLGLVNSVHAAEEKYLDNIPLVSGYLRGYGDSVSIAGQIYDGYWYVGQYATMDIRGADWFRARIGFSDENTGSVTVSIEVDGDLVWRQGFKGGERAVPVEIALTGKRAMTLRVSGSNTSSIVFPEARVVKGGPAPQPSTSKSPTEASSPAPAAQTPAPFVVDPNDLEKLASQLRNRVDSKPELKSRISKSNVALMTFTLIDITSQSVASNVAEDLYTSMINTDFPLVERGQLDKILKELKIQDTALIDPATAKKIGQMSGCDLIVVGSVSDRGQFVVINCRMLETATGRALAAERVEPRKILITR